ncbi:MAG: YhbY family RNA-binding protein [Sulfolobaceae archaeon]
MSSEDIRMKVKKAKARHADVRIGKKGLTDGVINEIKRRLEYSKVIKVRIGLKVEDRRKFAEEVAEKTNSKLIEVRGYTFILAKKDDKTRSLNS